ncbi:MAG: hypothetical protein IT245_00910, partial [Bacteroidia bacterium]|nr:hypothetical protein [Bacteroidia bacterium]
MRAKKAILIILLFASSYSNAQNIVYKFLTIKEGLSTNNIFKVKFDHQGFLWIAHDNGISRYDGFKFKHYISPVQKSNVYTDLTIGPDGKVWMTNLGLQVFYIDNDEMKLFKSFNLNYPPSTVRVSFLNNGNLIFNAEGGLIEFDIKSGKEYKTKLNLTIQNLYVNDGVAYFNNIVNGKLYKYKNRKLDSLDLQLPYSVIYANDSIIICSYNVANHLYIKYGKDYKNTLVVPLGYNYNHSEQNGQYLYAFTTGSVVKIDLKNSKFTMSTVMEGRSYTHFSKDKLGNEWYSTLNEGIVVKPYSNVQLIEIGEKSNFIKLSHFRGHAYGITADNQLYRMYHDHVEKVLEFDDFMDNKPIIVAKNLNNQYILIGNSRFLLIDSNFIPHKYFNQLALKDASLHENGNIYMATTGNIFYHKFTTSIINSFASKEFINSNDIDLKRVNLIGRFNNVKFDSTDGVLYFGGIPGLFKLKNQENPEEIKNGDEQIFSSFIDIYSPYVIIGTIQSGIIILKDGNIYRHFNSLNSTLGNTIIKIKLYNDRIWLLSSKGIHTINLQDFSIQTFSYIGAVEFNRNTDFTLADGILYLIAGQKTYKVKLNELRKSPPVIPVYFNYFEIGELKQFDLKKIILQHDQNSFSIGIEMPAAPVLGNVEYEYSLNNINWFQLSKGQDKIYLNQLPPGNYSLNVRQIGIPKKMYTL